MTSLTQQDLAVIRDITQDIVYLTIGSKKHIEINSLGLLSGNPRSLNGRDESVILLGYFHTVC